MVINTNILGINSNRNLRTMGARHVKASQKLSSGLKINSAADDASGLAISEKMKAQIRGLQQAERNVQDGISLIQTAEGGMSEISSMIIRQRELIIQALNDTNQDEDREKIQLEIDQLREEIDGTVERTKFNNIPLLCIPKVDADTTEFLVKLRNSNYVLSNGVLNFDACKADGSGLTDLNFQNSSKSLLKLENDLGSVVLNIRQDCNLVSTVPHAGGMLTTWDYRDDSKLINVRIEQHVKIVPNSNGIGESFEITNTIHNNVGYPTKMDFLFGIDTDFPNDLNPDYLLDNISNAVTTGQIFTGNKKPQIIDLYSDENKNLNVQIDVSDSNNPPDKIMVGQYNMVNTFNYTGGESITDSAYSIVWEAKQFDASNTQYSFSTKFGVSDPRKNPELGYVTEKLNPLHIQCGANKGDGMYIDRYDCRTETLNIHSIVVKPRDAAEASLGKLDSSLDTINTYRATAGSQQNRLEHTKNSASVAFTNLEDANSRITDTDTAKEMMEFTKTLVLSKATQAMLVQARQQPQDALKLLG